MKLTIFENLKSTTKNINDNFKVYHNVKLTNDFSSLIKLILSKYIIENSLTSQRLSNIEDWQKDISDFVKEKTNNHNLFILMAEFSKDNPELGQKYINFLLKSKINPKDNSISVNIKLNDNCSLQLKILNNYSKNIISNIISTSILINDKEELNISKNIENNQLSVWYDRNWLIKNERDSGIDIFLKAAAVDENLLKEYQKEENDNKIKRINLLSKKFNIENNLADVFVAILERESFQGNINLSKKISEDKDNPIYFEYNKQNNDFTIVKKNKDQFNDKQIQIICKGEFLNRQNINISYNKNMNMEEIYSLNSLIKNFIDKSQYIYPIFDWQKINKESFNNNNVNWKHNKKSEFSGCYQPENPIYFPLKNEILNLIKQTEKRIDIDLEINSHKARISFDKNNLNLQLDGKNMCRFNLNKDIFMKNNSKFFLSNIYFLKDEKIVISLLNSLNTNNKFNINTLIKNEIIKTININKEKIIE